jgi:hypothetical protein
LLKTPRNGGGNILQINVLNQATELLPRGKILLGEISPEGNPPPILGVSLTQLKISIGALVKQVRKSHTERFLTYPKVIPKTDVSIATRVKPNPQLKEVLNLVQTVPEWRTSYCIAPEKNPESYILP